MPPPPRPAPFVQRLRRWRGPGPSGTITGAQPPAPLSVAAGVLILTLCDGTTPLHLGPSLDHAVLRDWVTFHTGAPLVAAEQARFAVGTWADLMPVDRFAIGLPDYPDRSATLIVEMPDLSQTGPRLTGPGIADPGPPVAARNRSLPRQPRAVPDGV